MAILFVVYNSVLENMDTNSSYDIFHSIGVSYYDSSIRQLNVLEVWEDRTSDFPMIDLSMHSHIHVFRFLAGIAVRKASGSHASHVTCIWFLVYVAIE